ncbi:MAG: hypothetical protein ACYCWW_09800 [Deltaproteobacteria bacterium]
MPGPMVPRLLAACLALSLASATALGAPPIRIGLSVKPSPGAEGCVAPERLEAAIAERLGHDPIVPLTPGSGRVIELDVRADGAEGFVARLALLDERQAIVGEPVAPPDSPRLTAAEPVAPKAAATTLQLRAGLGAVGSLGSAPSPAAGLGLDVELLWPRYALLFEGRSDLNATRPFEGGEVGTALELGEIAPCRRFGSLGACAVVALGAQTGQAAGLPGALQRSAPFAAVGARGLFELLVAGPFSLRGSLELLAPLTRENVLVGDNLAFTTPPLAGTAELSGLLEIF